MTTTTSMKKAYYNHENYFSETDMSVRGWSEERKAGQRELNWGIRLEHYAKNSSDLKNCAQFRKMVDDWAERFEFPSPGVPTMTMLWILKLARENGIVSDTLREFQAAEEALLKKRPGFASVAAAVPFNEDKRRKLALAALKAHVERCEKRAAAKTGAKIGSAERRVADAAHAESVKNGRDGIEKKSAEMRKRGCDAETIGQNISQWEHELQVEVYYNRLVRCNGSK